MSCCEGIKTKFCPDCGRKTQETKNIPYIEIRSQLNKIFCDDRDLVFINADDFDKTSILKKNMTDTNM